MGESVVFVRCVYVYVHVCVCMGREEGGGGGTRGGKDCVSVRSRQGEC